MSEDATELKIESIPKKVTVLMKSEGPCTTDLEGSAPVMPSGMQENSHPVNAVVTVKNMNEIGNSEVAEEILYLDEVLEASSSDAMADTNSSGSPTEIKAICIESARPSVNVPGVQTSHNSKIFVEETHQPTLLLGDGTEKSNHYSGMVEQNHKRLPEELSAASAKKEAHFELRPYQEEKKPSKLFDCMSDKDLIRVKKVRTCDEIAELERERQELIKGQAVKKNPGIAAKWWNPPQQKTLEEELGQDQLESHRRYEERKQKKREASTMQQTIFKHTEFSDEEPKINKENIVVDKIDFSSARSQFLQRPQNTSQPTSPKSSPAQPHSAKPRAIDITHEERPNETIIVDSSAIKDHRETTAAKAYSLESSPTEQTRDNNSENGINKNSKSWMDDEDFTCVRAVMTIIKDEDPSISTSYPSHRNEHVSGLEDNYFQYENTTVAPMFSNNLSKENISDPERLPALLETSMVDDSLGSPPQIMNSTVCLKPQHENFLCATNRVPVLTEEQLQYYANVLVKNAIQQAVTQLNIPWELLELPEQCSTCTEQDAEAEEQPILLEEQSKCSSKQEMQNASPKGTTVTPVSPMDTDTYSVVQPPEQYETSCKKQEFSYFSKYSEAAELRSTALVARPQDKGTSSGPFKLRSHKQRTLSMIEEEIRAAQEREEELKRQRKMKTFNSSGKHRDNSLSPTHVFGSRTTCDLASENSGGIRHPKNLQTPKDYEINKVKYLEQTEDTRVLAATSVTYGKSNMTPCWEAEFHTTHDEEGEEE